MTIVAVAKLKARAGSEDEVRTMALSLVEPTLAEPGCLSYQPYVDPVDPGSWVVVEEWTDQASFDAHLTSPHMAAAFKAGEALLDGPPRLRTLTM